jgi:D-alanyl-D-alanine carboxypeptidase
LADYQDAIQKIDAFIKREMNTFNAPGISVGITNADQTLCVKSYGLANLDAAIPVNPQTLFQIGSISKSFTSIVLLQLQEQGLVDLSAPLTQYLPWFEISSENKPITLQHLMSHTAGIIMGSDATPCATSEVWDLRHTRATAPPGERFHYSNSGYKALGLVIEAVLGQDLGEILKQRVLDPLGMSESRSVITNQIRSLLAVGYESLYDDRPLPSGGALAPAPWFENATADGSISSNPGDMCLYLRCLLNEGAGLIKPESFQQMIAPLIPSEDGLHGQHYGLGLFTSQISGHRVIGHSGGMVGYTADLLADQDAKLGIVVLMNGPGNPEILSRHLLSLWIASQSGEEQPPDFTADKTRTCAADYTGEYQCGKKSFTLVSRDNQLCLMGADVILEPLKRDVYLVPHPDFELFQVRFGRSDQEVEGDPGQVVEAFHGPDWYVRSNYQGETNFDIPPVWLAFTGHYRAHNPWLTNFRVLIQKDHLILCHPQYGGEILHQTGEHSFRIGEDPLSPEFIHFELILNGRAMGANLSGSRYCRAFTA